MFEGSAIHWQTSYPPANRKVTVDEASVLVSVKKSDPWQPNSIQHPELLSAVAGSQLTGLTIKCIGRYTGARAGTGAGISSADLMLARR